MGSGTDGEGVDPAGSLPRPVPYVVAGGHDRGEGGSNAGGRQVHSRDQLPQSGKPETASNDKEGGEADIGGREFGRRLSYLRPDVEVVVTSGPGRDEDDTDRENDHPPPSTPPISRGEKPEGGWA